MPSMSIVKRYLYILCGSGLLVLTLAPLSFARARVSPLSKKDVPRLLKELKSRDSNLKCSAAFHLSIVEPIEAARPAIPLLFNMLKESDQCGREGAIESLGLIAPDDDRVFYAAVSLLDDATFPEKWRAANTISGVCCNKKDLKCEREIGARLANSVDTEVLTRYVTSLRCFGSKVIPTLNKALYHSDRFVRLNAVFSLSSIGESSSSSENVRMQIINILKKRLNGADTEFSEIIKTAIAVIRK
jgi:HEAT repeat protein